MQKLSKDSKLKEQKDREEKAILAELKPAVEINENSEKIIRKKGHSGPIAGWEKHFEMFLKRRELPPPNPQGLLHTSMNLMIELRVFP